MGTPISDAAPVEKIAIPVCHALNPRTYPRNSGVR
jgi:hypothetical protein